MIGLEDIREQLRWVGAQGGREEGTYVIQSVTIGFARLVWLCPDGKELRERWEKRREKWAQRRGRMVGSPPGVPTKGFSAASIPIGSRQRDGHFPHPSSRFGGIHPPPLSLYVYLSSLLRARILSSTSSPSHTPTPNAKFTARVFHPYLFRLLLRFPYSSLRCYLHVPHHSTKLSLWDRKSVV